MRVDFINDPFPTALGNALFWLAKTTWDALVVVLIGALLAVGACAVISVVQAYIPGLLTGGVAAALVT